MAVAAFCRICCRASCAVSTAKSASTIRERYEKVLDAIVDAGGCPQEPTTVVDLTPMGTGGDPEVVREGRGSLQALGL